MDNKVYSITFNQVPDHYISRDLLVDDLINDLKTPGASKSFKLMGVRGCGKSVTMELIKRRMKSESDWIVFEMSIQTDLTAALIANLKYELSLFSGKNKVKGISASMFGIGGGITFDSSRPEDELIMLRELLDKVVKSNKKVLVFIDEVMKNSNMLQFASIFSILLKEGYPIAIVMAGLNENIMALQSEKSSTFILRAKSYVLEPLDDLRIANNYARYLNVSDAVAIQLSKMSKGYALAFQSLGRIMSEMKATSVTDEVIEKFKEDMSSYSYQLIWNSLTVSQQNVLKEIAKRGGTATTAELKEVFGDGSYNQLRRALADRQLIDCSVSGVASFMLPEFTGFVLFRIEYENA